MSKVLPTFKLSVPTKSQVVKSVERVFAVFIVAGLTSWLAIPNKFSKAAALAGIAAGITAVYQLVVSSVTTIV